MGVIYLQEFILKQKNLVALRFRYIIFGMNFWLLTASAVHALFAIVLVRTFKNVVLSTSSSAIVNECRLSLQSSLCQQHILNACWKIKQIVIII